MEISNDKKIVLDKDLSPENLCLFGLKLGDSVEEIPTDKENGFQYGSLWISSNSEASYRADSERKSVIVEFLLRGEFLTDLKLTSPRRIVRKFGKPQAIEKSNGTHYYFYPERKLVVSWWHEYDKLFGVYIGDNIIKQTEYTVKNFLDKYYEFKAMVPDYRNWNHKSLKYNEPRLYRLKELESLIQAFDIGTDLLQDFQNRKFLERRTLSDFEPIIKDIEKYALNDKYEKERYQSEIERAKSVRWFEMLIQNFMRFSEEMRNILKFNSGVLEAGSLIFRYSINKTQKLLNDIDLKELKEIDELLCKVLDPKSKIFTKSELIKNFNFPDVDLEAIDMENY
ncbi:hypothetical protein [Winogradskyella sp.]|uniref:hypothetical protein n=1 Tax=Winogradskyella sp. TaxID=1883156 RepID=UPI002614AE80|nr:hypothetical protein [Winogradskyella sp.]